MNGVSLEELLASEDAELRRQAIARAAATTEPRTTELLFQGLADADWRVRKEALRGLRARPSEPRLVAQLVEALLPGDNVGLRNAAVEALGAHGEAAITAIEAMAPRLDADGLKLACEALGLTKAASAMPCLRRLARHGDPNVRAAALEAVAEVGHADLEGAAQLLDEALAATDPFLRLVTLDVGRRLDLSPSWERLEGLLSDPVLVHTALELAARLGEPAAAPHFVRELEAALAEGPQGAALEASRKRSLERPLRALHQLAQFIQRSELTLEAARGALAELTPPSWERLVALYRSPFDRQVAEDALLVLAARGDTEAASAALAALEDEELAPAARRAIEILGDAMTNVLLQRLDDSEGHERAAVITLLADLCARRVAPEEVRTALRALVDTSTVVTRAWLDAMTQLADVDGLVRALEAHDGTEPPAVRRSLANAARVLVQRAPERAGRLVRGVAPISSRAECVCWFLSANAEPLWSSTEDLAFLVAAAGNPSSHVRVAALDALSRLRHPDAVEAVVFALNDEAFEVQAASVRALGELRDDGGKAPGTPYLIALAKSASDPGVQVEALGALGKTTDPAALDFLIAQTVSESVPSAVTALGALAGFADERAAAALTRALSHSEPEVVKAALQAVGQLRSIPEDEVGRCLSHAVWDVRRLAADVLGSSRTRFTRQVLTRRLPVETEPTVREAIVRSLARHESTSSLKSILPPHEREQE